jgi:hypothetical protein
MRREYAGTRLATGTNASHRSERKKLPLRRRRPFETTELVLAILRLPILALAAGQPNSLVLSGESRVYQARLMTTRWTMSAPKETRRTAQSAHDTRRPGEAMCPSRPGSLGLVADLYPEPQPQQRDRRRAPSRAGSPRARRHRSHKWWPAEHGAAVCGGNLDALDRGVVALDYSGDRLVRVGSRGPRWVDLRIPGRAELVISRRTNVRAPPHEIAERRGVGSPHPRVLDGNGVDERAEEHWLQGAAGRAPGRP